MRMGLALSGSVLVFAACQSVPEKTDLVEEPRERCDTVLTGSRIPQCNRGDVRIITREELERSPPSWTTTNAGDPEGALRPGR